LGQPAGNGRILQVTLLNFCARVCGWLWLRPGVSVGKGEPCRRSVPSGKSDASRVELGGLRRGAAELPILLSSAPM